MNVLKITIVFVYLLSTELFPDKNDDNNMRFSILYTPKNKYYVGTSFVDYNFSSNNVIRIGMYDVYFFCSPHLSLVSDGLTTSIFLKPHHVEVSINSLIFFTAAMFEYAASEKIGYWIVLPQTLTNPHVQFSIFNELITFNLNVNTDFYLFSKTPDVFSEVKAGITLRVNKIRKEVPENRYLKASFGMAMPIVNSKLPNNDPYFYLRIYYGYSPSIREHLNERYEQHL